jgi:uncharacterized MAPEG superfamily protein
MTHELTLLAWTLVLALVQISLAATLRTQETGAKWNMGARDGAAPTSRPITQRMQRAQANLFETLPLFAAAVLIAHVANIHTTLTVWGCALYLLGRMLYVPLYAAGIPLLRTLVWMGSIAGLVMIIVALLSQ